MGQRRRRALIAPVCVIALLTGCGDVATEDEAGYEPAAVEPIEGSDLSRVTLTEDAARRIGLDTSVASDRADRIAVPESAIWVDVNGDAWVYTQPEPLVFVRARVVVDRYEDGTAYLAKGLDPGTEVASVGVPELIGSEFGI